MRVRGGTGDIYNAGDDGEEAQGEQMTWMEDFLLIIASAGMAARRKETVRRLPVGQWEKERQ